MSVTGLAAALARSGVRTRIASLDYVEHGRRLEPPGVTSISVLPSMFWRRLRGWSPALAAAISKVASERVDIIHHHGLWMYPGIYARRAANRFGVPLVISPRGMLDSWSLRRGVVRKAFASAAYERRNLRTARLFHATSDMEAEAIRRYGLKQPIAVISNGIELPDSDATLPRALVEDRLPGLRGRRAVLFMGRLHPKKGLDMLIGAWSTLQRDIPGWHLVIAGPDQGGLRGELEAAVARDSTIRDNVTFSGMLEGTLKDAVLDHADVFVLPTRSENFGMAIAEALAHGVPVVTTTAAPWPDLVTYDCGWWVAPEPKAITEALRSAMLRTPEERRAMGARGRRYASERFSWDSVGAQMVEMYRWVVTGGAVPSCVRES